ncbi:hypothetical protein LLE49_19935 [Alicyclobacillus tolerans]|uniref:hypothetical protein n=1 Tax=Alicyclobacillus tolerans TaxID=90970 RepID=UPI001F20EE0D|nr:hypothetical protein [Alicyclobacillus tolerans]MCF8566994.1 hypothetical protein [Alicyclobacillus tolerans]
MEQEYVKNQRKAAREWRRKNLFGENPCCSACLQEETVSLVHPRKVKRLLEKHHIAGLHEGITVNLCRNCHAMLTDQQLTWDDVYRQRDRDGHTLVEAELIGAIEFQKHIVHLLEKELERMRAKKKAAQTDDRNMEVTQ